MNLDYDENDLNIKDKFGKKTLFFYDDIIGKKRLNTNNIY
jgi:hypothetical protein